MSTVRHSDAVGTNQQSQTNFTLSIGKRRHHPQGQWQPKEYTFAQFVAEVEQHRRGKEDGPCFLQGACVGGFRKAMSMESNSILVVDVESGATIEEVETSIREAGLGAVIWTKHGHLDDTSQINRDDLHNWSNGAMPTPELCAEFLATMYDIRPEILHGLEIINDCDHTSEGVMITVKHQPLPKLQAVFLLSEPFKFLERVGTQQEAIKEWKERKAGFCAAMKLSVSETCLNPSHMFFFPRHGGGSAHEVRSVGGIPLNLDNYQKIKITRNRGTKKSAELVFEARPSAFADMPPEWVQAMDQALLEYPEKEAKHLRELNCNYAIVPYLGSKLPIVKVRTANDKGRLNRGERLGYQRGGQWTSIASA